MHGLVDGHISMRMLTWRLSIATLSTDVTPRIGETFSPSGTGHSTLRFCTRASALSPVHLFALLSSEHARP